MTDHTLAVDVGGTWLRSAVIQGDKLILPLKKEAPGFRFHSMPLIGLQELFLGEISSLVESYAEKGFRISKVALAFPGPMKGGLVYSAPTLWGEMSVPYPLLSGLKKKLRDRGITEVFAVNDVTAMGWSYVTDKNRTFCIITVSSGIGNKIFLNGQVLTGERAIGGEIGHWYCGDVYRDFICDCGGRGHLGGVSSGRGIEKIAEKLKERFAGSSPIASLKQITATDIIDGLKKGDALAQEALSISVVPLANAISLINLATGVDRFIIAGGFALGCGDRYVKELNKSLEWQQFRGQFTENGAGIAVILGADNDFNALKGLARMMESLPTPH
jgi:predicted NBD/HSP70 family sugar kinase